MTIFTDKDGTEFEEVDVKELSDVQPQDIVIRPVKQQPKYKVVDSDEDFSLTPLPGFNRCIEVDLNVSEDQAQLIKAWIEAGMKYLNEPMKDFPNEVAETYYAARHSMRENN